MDPFRQIKINGKIYTPSTLKNLVEGQAEKHVFEVYDFLNHWFDSAEYIETQTSGSTGTPKPIRISKAGMVHSATLTQNFFKLKNSHTALLCLPAQYIAGKMMLVRACVTGFNLVLKTPEANPFETLDNIIDFAAVTPYQLYHSIKSLSPIKNCQLIVGGSSVSAALEQQCQQLDTTIYETYGMTETSSHVALRKVNGNNRTEYFTPLPGINLSVDKRNCLIIDVPEITQDSVITNDIVDFSGNDFKWLGRWDRVINSGGIKISPEQVEKKIEEIINRRFYVTSTFHPSLQEAICLVIEGDPFNNTEKNQLIDKMKAILTPYQIPQQILFEKKLKTTLSGKLIRKKNIDNL